MLDAVVIGGGPAGLQAALTLGRAQRTAVVIDGGERRNAAATAMNNFVTRDGTPPDVLRAHAAEELGRYGIGVRSGLVEDVTGDASGLRVHTADGVIEARRVILAVGMVDVLPDVPGLRDHWGHAAFACPFCHGHELRGRAWGVWTPGGGMILEHAPFLARKWTSRVTVFTDGAEVDDAVRARIEAAGVAVEPRKVEALLGDGALRGVRVAGGAEVVAEAWMFRPPQRQTALVQRLGLTLDPQGYVAIDDMARTSRDGIFAAGDATTMMQAAILGAAGGMRAAAGAVHSLP